MGVQLLCLGLRQELDWEIEKKRMLSSLSSLVWGEVGVREEEPGPPTTTIHERDHSLEDDWVVVGRVAQFPGTLSNNFSLPESDTPMHVSPVRSQVGDVDQDDVQEDVNPTKITRNLLLQSVWQRC